MAEKRIEAKLAGNWNKKNKRRKGVRKEAIKGKEVKSSVQHDENISAAPTQICVSNADTIII